MRAIDISPEELEKEVVQTTETLMGKPLYPGSVERLFTTSFIVELTRLIALFNHVYKQNLLAHSTGKNLDKLAEFYGVKRLPPKPAITNLRFSIDQPLSFDVVIPKGTRATADSKVFFETTQEAIIPAGQLSVEVQAVCTTAGSIGNGYAIGQINKLVDPVPYITKVENTSMSMYGTDTEDDERFRERIRLSMERFSNAGSREAYIYHTKTAHQDIEDVSVFSPQPGVVKVVFLLKGGQTPDPQMIQLVQKHLSDEKVRPLTDQVVVEAPQIVSYNITLTYYVHRKDEALAGQIQTKVQEAVQDFVSWTKTKIGRDVLPEELISRVKEAGAYRVSLTEPQYLQIAQDQVAHAQSVQVSYGGLVDD